MKTKRYEINMFRINECKECGQSTSKVSIGSFDFALDENDMENIFLIKRIKDLARKNDG